MDSIRVESIAEGAAVRLTGDVTLAEAASLKKHLSKALEAPVVLLDCENLGTADLAVLQLLLAAKRLASKRGNTFRINDSGESTLAACCAAAGLPGPASWQ